MKKVIAYSLLALLGLSTVAAFAPDADASCRCRVLRSGRVVCSGC